MKILIVSILEDWRGWATSILSSVGFTVKTAQNGTRFDLCLIDLAVAEHGNLRAVLDTAKRVVVLFPLQMTVPRMRRMFKAGVYDCIDKPYSKESLILACEEAMK